MRDCQEFPHKPISIGAVKEKNPSKALHLLTMMATGVSRPIFKETFDIPPFVGKVDAIQLVNLPSRLKTF